MSLLDNPNQAINILLLQVIPVAIKVPTMITVWRGLHHHHPGEKKSGTVEADITVPDVQWMADADPHQ